MSQTASLDLVSAPHARVATPQPARTLLAGWGANLRSTCELIEPETAPDVSRWLDRRGTIARGLGRSYGDPALNGGGRVLGMQRLDRYLGFDADSGVLRCEAGVSLEQIIRDFAPRGWFPSIAPGTKYVTVGGCIANDIHGKAHHSQGSFASCVESFRILLASGEVLSASREHHQELFWANFGGVGLLGIILDVTLRLRRIQTTFYRQKAIVARDFSEMLAAFDEHDAGSPYSVAYVDFASSGRRLGRGVLTVGDHALREQLPPALAMNPLRVHRAPLLTVPLELPSFAVNPLSGRVVNAAIKAKQAHAGAFTHYEGFFFPLDMLGRWNRVYGRPGAAQYQFVLPFEAGEHKLRALLEAIVLSRAAAPLNVLKRMGRPSGGPLSFPFEGYTFAIDFPIRSGTAKLVQRLDAMVLDAGGRLYLGKDSLVQPNTLAAMYPLLPSWQATKAKYDPDQVFVSDLARRVGLITSAKPKSS